MNMTKYSIGLLEEELKNKVVVDRAPFTEAEVDAKECFASHFMSDFLAGKGVGFVETVLPGFEGEKVSRRERRGRGGRRWRSYERSAFSAISA